MGGVHVAFGLDAGYLPWCATTVRSLLDIHGAGLDVTVLHDGSIAGAGRARLAGMVSDAGAEVAFIAVDSEVVAGLPALDRFGRVVWLRFLLPRLLPDVDRVLYLDADTLVVDPLDALLDTDLGGLPIGAVANVVEPSLFGHVRSIGIEDPHRFLNSGVLLFDLERMRAEGSTDELLSVATDRASELRWPDQDALNIVFRDRWMPLHPRWNAMNSLWEWAPLANDVFGADVVAEATSSPAIVHFEGPSLCKPWHSLCQHPWREQYWRTLRRTPWADREPEDRTVATRMIAHLPEGRRVDAYKALLRWRARTGRAS